jgi:MHS family proline/betaine transporter-like MFS transporter
MIAAQRTSLSGAGLLHRPVHSSVAASRLILAGCVGNALEWYDFAVYGYFAALIGHNFFPAQDPTVALIAAFGVFAAAFLARPIGAVIFGHIGDRYGRKPALVISVAAMAVATTLMGLLPTYAEVGAVAPVLLIVLRLIQGLSVGGEHATSCVFLVESSRPDRRGLSGSFAVAAVTAGMLLGSAIGAIVASHTTQPELLAWGWRIPFLLGIVLGAMALYLRQSVIAEARTTRASHGLPIAQAFRSDWRGLLRGFVMTMTPAVGFYLTFIYLVTYMQRVDGLTLSNSLRINTFSMVVMLILTPAAGWLSDRVGRRVVLGGALIATLLLVWPLFQMLGSKEVAAIALGQAGLATLFGIYGGAYPAALVEMFAPTIRCSATSLSLNLGMGLLGGTAPMVAVYLVSRAHIGMGPVYYLMAVVALSLIAVITWRRAPEWIGA